MPRSNLATTALFVGQVAPASRDPDIYRQVVISKTPQPRRAARRDDIISRHRRDTAGALLDE
jgi:hypothetical protein